MRVDPRFRYWDDMQLLTILADLKRYRFPEHDQMIRDLEQEFRARSAPHAQAAKKERGGRPETRPENVGGPLSRRATPCG